MMNLNEYRKRPALLADWLPWAGLVAPGVVLNKDGSFQRTARFRGPDLDSATQGELVATSARLNNALRRLGSGWALFVEAERREAAHYPECSFPEPLSWLIDEERRAAFEEAGSHFESGYHLTLLYLPPEEARSRAGNHEKAPRMAGSASTKSLSSRFCTRPSRPCTKPPERSSAWRARASRPASASPRPPTGKVPSKARASGMPATWRGP